MSWMSAAQKRWHMNWNTWWSTDDPQNLWLKYQILIYFEGLKTTEVRQGAYKNSEKEKMFI